MFHVVSLALHNGKAYGDLESRRRLFFALAVSLICHLVIAVVLGYFSLGNSLPRTLEIQPSLSVTFSSGKDALTLEASTVAGTKMNDSPPVQPTDLAAAEQGGGEPENPDNTSRKGAGTTVGAAGKKSATVTREVAPHYYSSEWLGRRPIPLHRITPKYPAGVEGVVGRVSIVVLINEKGGVDGVRVLASEPSGVFDQESIMAFTEARYAPGLIGGVPVKAKFVVDIQFDPGEAPKVGASM